MDAEIKNKLYDDVGSQVAKPTGELIGLLPRVIKAALAPLEKWILQREYNVAETQLLLEEKLKNVSPDLIESPEAYIAVPALQYISYCMDNEELRNMYANLLASSMNKVVKNGVHPAFVQIISQLCPDEAKVLNYMSQHHIIPIINVRRMDSRNTGYDIIKNFSNVGELSGCETPYTISQYFDNLLRLGLIKNGIQFAKINDDTVYEPLKKHPYILTKTEMLPTKNDSYIKNEVIESYIELSDYGKCFCHICLNTESSEIKVVLEEQTN